MFFQFDTQFYIISHKNIFSHNEGCSDLDGMQHTLPKKFDGNSDTMKNTSWRELYH